ncbi:hypothetical protein BpHYR1_034460 [Brachionus plicatilis]|uniref:Uncharacterized protein n=1 Tax=Brachionus plicatilis TaxID=10195 RepID=A0A3M7SCQ2_BRAPC|nr:hypothetical protein BpHYR1_034460 [Brachionus plicatilis]
MIHFHIGTLHIRVFQVKLYSYDPTLDSQLMKKDVLTSGFVLRSLFTRRKLTLPSVKIKYLWLDQSEAGPRLTVSTV